MSLACHAGVLIRILLIAVALAVAVPGLALGQDASGKAEGVICREPECDVRRSLPASVGGPMQAEPFLTGRVRNTPASALESRLPGMPFESWLFSILQGHLARAHEPFADWSLTFCEEPKSAIPRAGPDLCIHVKVPVVDDRLVNVHVGVAAGSTSLAGETGWKEIPPAVRDIYIDRLDPERVLEQHAVDSLDVDALADLEPRLRLPFDEWPAVDFTSSVSWSRESPEPDNLMRFTIAVENRGRRDADRAAVSVLLSIPQLSGEATEIRREWFPRIPAGRRASLDIFARVPRGDATAIVSAATVHGFKRVREDNSDDNDAAVHLRSGR